MPTASSTFRLTVRLVAVAAVGLLVAACSVEGLIERGLSQIEGVGDVNIDFSEEGGSFTITSEEGEVFGIEVDDQGQSTIRTDEGTMTTTVDGEVPPEITAAIDLPSTFTAKTVTRMEDTEDGDGMILQGTVEGNFTDLLDELEASLRDRWPQVERMVMAEGHMGAIVATDEDEEQGVHANLAMEDDEPEGLLQIMLIQQR